MTALVGIDWGTTNARALRFDAAGTVVELRERPLGILRVANGDFAGAFADLAGDWRAAAPGVPVLMCGMIGSRQGWREVPYADCPATLPQIASALLEVSLGADRGLHIVPGLRVLGDDGEWDVMRGEETQLWGADLPDGSCAVLPGTHSKWAWMGRNGAVHTFRTYMTGELYALCTQHGILGRLMDFGHDSPEDFESGVRRGLAEHAQATHVLFAARTAALMGRVSSQGLPDFLSGLLIGIEIASARRAGPCGESITLIGDELMCRRYAAALLVAGMHGHIADPGVTLRGQWRVAQAAGLLKGLSA